MIKRIIFLAVFLACQLTGLQTIEAAKLVSCPGVAAGASCTLTAVSLTGTTPATIISTSSLTEIADPAGHGKSDYVYNYSGTLDATLDYRVWCYCTKDTDVYYWMYAWEPFETRIDVTLSSRSTYAGEAVASVTGAVGSVTSPVTVGTNNDKTGYAVNSITDKSGYSLSSAGSAAFWDVVRSGHTTAGTFGEAFATVQDTMAGQVTGIKAKTDLIPASPATETTMTRGLGLLQENEVEDDITYNALGLKTGSMLYLYSSRTAAISHDKATGLLAKYAVTITRDVSTGVITLYRVTREL